MTTTQHQPSPTEANGNVEVVDRERSLPEKLLAAAIQIENIDKDGHNDHFDYDFASAENILRHVRGPLADEGLWLIPKLKGITQRQGGRSNSTITTATVEFSLIDVLTRDSVVCEWAGEGDDPSDKGLSKAYTAAIKTFLRTTLLLPLGDDPEADPRADKRSEGNGPTDSSGPRTLTDDEADRLVGVVAEVGLIEHLDTRLRSFGVSKATELNTEQAIKVYEWAKEQPSG